MSENILKTTLQFESVEDAIKNHRQFMEEYWPDEVDGSMSYYKKQFETGHYFLDEENYLCVNYDIPATEMDGYGPIRSRK